MKGDRDAATRSEEGDEAHGQYEHIKESLLDEGRSEETAEEIAARTVNKSGRVTERRGARRSLLREDISLGSQRRDPRAPVDATRLHA